MKQRSAEILCIGTEILMGDIVNTNAAYLAKELAGLGINVYHRRPCDYNRWSGPHLRRPEQGDDCPLFWQGACDGPGISARNRMSFPALKPGDDRQQ